MPQAEVIAPLELIINRTFNAPRERVFRAWTEAAELDRWFGCEGMTSKSFIDLRVGGSYRIEMRHSSGNVGIVSGIYREILPPERLSFTWNASGGSAPVTDTLVTLEFFEVDGKTQVTLTHQNFYSEEVRKRHEQGWNVGLDHMATML